LEAIMLRYKVCAGLVVGVTAISLAAGCSSGGSAGTAVPSSSPTPGTSTPNPSSVLKAGLPNFPTALADSSGRAVYMFVKDNKGPSTCTGPCAAAWPPVLATGNPVRAGAGVDPSKLGMVARSDGSVQVTYGGWPLYYYLGDQAPGQTTGEGNVSFGAAWFLIGADGNQISSG
jgi:predicted lipoprotein with Yx(FWY)xxD motif